MLVLLHNSGVIRGKKGKKDSHFKHGILFWKEFFYHDFYFNLSISISSLQKANVVEIFNNKLVSILYEPS